MMGVSRRNVLILGLVSALSIGGYIFASSQLYGIGFPLDDAWIHQTYARNLASGEGWSFFPGEPSAGLTAPLWALMLSLGFLIGLGPFVFTFLLGWAVLWGISVLGVYTWRWLSDKRGWWEIGAGLLLVIEWHLVWAASSGMETLLFSALVFIVLVWLFDLTKEGTSNQTFKWLRVGLLIGLSIWVRPEGLTLLGPAGFVAVFSHGDWNQRVKRSLLVLVGFVLVFSFYLNFNRWLADAWWPNTFYAKQTEYAIHRQFPLSQRLFSQFSLLLVGVGVVLLPGYLYSFYSSYRKKSWGAISAWLWVIGFVGLYAIRLPVTYQHGRYIMPVVPVFLLLGYAGVAEIVRTDTPKRWKRIFSLVWVLLIPAIDVVFWFMGAQAYAQDVAFINSEMVVMAQWIAGNTNEDELIAAHDIGALGYFTQRPILDLAGLVSPEVIPFIRDEDLIKEYLNENHLTYLVTFPSWYPDLVKDVQKIYHTGGQFSQALGGENMSVYLWSPLP